MVNSHRLIRACTVRYRNVIVQVYISAISVHLQGYETDQINLSYLVRIPKHRFTVDETEITFTDQNQVQCMWFLGSFQIINEPVHEISYNEVCVTSKASDQPAHTHSLIRAFASHWSILWLLNYWLNTIWSF